MESPLESPADEITRLRNGLNELRGIVARPELWTVGEPPASVDTALNALFGIANEIEERFAQHTVNVVRATEALRDSERNPRLIIDNIPGLVALTDIEERTRAEDGLRESEHQSRLVLDSIPGLVALLDATGGVELVNPQILQYTGKTLEELKQWGQNDIVHQEDLPHVIDIFTRSIASGQPYDIVQRLRRADGVYRWFQNSGCPIRDTNGLVARWCVLLTDIDERKRAEDALRESERELRLIVDSIPGLVATLTPAGAIEAVNNQVLAYCGRTLEQLQDWATGDTVHPEDLPRVVEVTSQSMISGDPYEIEERIRRFDGVYRWFQIRGLPLRDTSGNIVRWYNLLVDIDERKRAEEALAASERNLKLIIDTIPALVWSARPDGGAEFFNRHYQDFAGLSEEEASDWGWTTAVHPDDVKGLSATWKGIMASEAPGEAEARLRRHDGEYRWFLFRANPLRDADGQILKWYGINTDIEDRKRAEVDLRRAYDSFADAQRLSHTGNFTADIVVDEHVWSEELYRIFEFDPAVPIRVQAVRDAIHPDDLPSFDAGFAQSLGGADFDLTFRIVTRSGKMKHVRSLAHLVERVAGRPLFIGAIQDVTETRLAEEALNRARSELAHVTRVTTLSTLTASIAHEVNQPLSGIITNAGTCLRMLDADPPNIEGARETAKRTIRDGHRASEVMTRLRALFSKRAFALESLNLNEAIKEVIALSRAECQRQRIMLHMELADDLPSITGDRIQLQQVILNLLRNALDAMVDVHDRQRELLIKTECDGSDRVRVAVRDAGVGIGAQAMEKLFDAFYTTKNDGMGIGLSISRSIIERHRGRLWAEANDGPGATFLLSIPRDADFRVDEPGEWRPIDTKV